jgi:hypothetical protein
MLPVVSDRGASADFQNKLFVVKLCILISAQPSYNFSKSRYYRIAGSISMLSPHETPGCSPRNTPYFRFLFCEKSEPWVWPPCQ